MNKKQESYNHNLDAPSHFDKKTFKILSAHWIKQNKSLQKQYLTWSNKCRQSSQNNMCNYIEKAANFMEKANEMLIEAKKHML
mgnify:CR=1 FL=1